MKQFLFIILIFITFCIKDTEPCDSPEYATIPAKCDLTLAFNNDEFQECSNYCESINKVFLECGPSKENSCKMTLSETCITGCFDIGTMSL